MLTLEQIQAGVRKIAQEYPDMQKVRQLKKVTWTSLVEFHTPAISLFILSEMKYRIEEELNIPVDLIHAPLPDDTILQINKQLLIY